MRESELAKYEKSGDVEKRDPRNSSLKFMYSIPQSQDSSTNSSNTSVRVYRAADK